MTQTLTQPEATQPPPEIAELLEQMKAEAEALDAGVVANDDDERLLARYMRKRSAIASEISRIKENIERVLSQKQREIEALDFVFMSRAESIVKKKLQGQKKKSITNEFGTVGFRTNAARLEVIDETRIPFDFMKQEWVVEKAKINEHFKETGEVVDGCQLKDAEEKFYVK